MSNLYYLSLQFDHYQIAGQLTDMPIGKADDEAAFRAMREVESRGWFAREREEEFAFFYYWDIPSEMKEFMEEEWGDFEKIEEDVYHAAQSLWSTANADARVRVRVKMLITRWKKRDKDKPDSHDFCHTGDIHTISATLGTFTRS